MTTRWWHHDDRDGVPTRTAYDNTTSSSYRQQAAPQQYSMQTPMRAEAAEFKPVSQAAPQAAPGFNRAGPAVAKAQLPKCWEYEDPLKDVHGPFDAAQIINWFAQDWFGTDLKIRRIGQYWTMLEYVLDELKAEARGQTPPPSTGYTSAPQQLPQAATTPAASYGSQRGTGMPAATSVYGRPAAAPAAADQWGGAGGSYSAAAAADDGWGAPAGSGRPERVERGYLPGATAAAVAPAAAQARPRGRGAAAADDYGGGGSGFGSEDYSGVRGRGARDKEREAAGGVQFGSDGKWERGYVIDRENRRGARGSKGYQDYDSYGDEYGGGGGGGSSSRDSRRGRGRGGRGDRGGGYGDDRESAGYDRASRILEGADDDEYGGSGRARGRAARDSRGLGMAAASAGGSGRDYKQDPAPAATWDSAGSSGKLRSRREGKASSNWEQGNSAAAAVAAATAGLGSLGLSTLGAAGETGGSDAAPIAATAATAEGNADGWGLSAAAETCGSAAADDGWGNSSAPVTGKWGDEPVESDTPTAEDASAAPAAAGDATAVPAVEKPQESAVVVDGGNWGSAAASSVNSPKRATDSGVDDAAAVQPPDNTEEPEDKAAVPPPLASEPEENSSKPAIAIATATGAGGEVEGDAQEKPKLSKVQQLILLQEQLTQQEADKAKTSPARNATSPRTLGEPLEPSAVSASDPVEAGDVSAIGEATVGNDDHVSMQGAGSAVVAHAESAAVGERHAPSDSVPAPEPAAAADDGPQSMADIAAAPAAADDQEQPITAAAAEAATAAGDKQEPRPAVSAGSEGGQGGMSVAGITAGIFSRVAGALMGGGSAPPGGKAASETAAEAKSDQGGLEATAGPADD